VRRVPRTQSRAFGTSSGFATQTMYCSCNGNSFRIALSTATITRSLKSLGTGPKR
jgi:hypothetical protein